MNKNIYYSTEITTKDLSVQENDIIISIPSIIHICDTRRREVCAYSPTERFEQTINQLKSIRKYNFKNVKVILQEMSEWLTDTQFNQLSELCDIVILYKGDPRTRPFCHQVGNKGLGELAVLQHITMLLKDVKIKTFIKFGGRYELRDTFDLNEFIKDGPVARPIIHDQIYTILYSIPGEYLSQYIDHIKQWLKYDTVITVERIMHQFYEKCDKKYFVECLNIEGCTSTGSWHQP